jgi:uncharacterized repeat protein (TIGR03803 family)
MSREKTEAVWQRRRLQFRPVLTELEDRQLLSLATLASFNGANGSGPASGVVMDSSGNLYGTTTSGGASNDGTVFELAEGSGTITTLASFNYLTGSFLSTGLIMDSSGNLFGITNFGGANGDGNIFELAKGSGTITTLASFDGSNGRYPDGGVVMDSFGNLFGTTWQGGASNYGTVFELNKGNGTITTLASFDGSNGRNPHGSLIVDSSGNLYGTTEFGYGSNSSGTVFELIKGSGTITTLVSFIDTNGQFPQGGLVTDGSGNLYGTTDLGGVHGDGNIVELAEGSSTATSLASLNGADGAYPHGSLIMDGSGNLYGAADEGGASNDGTVFELAEGSGTITSLALFNGTNGANPNGDLVMDSTGNLYGTTNAGGAHNDGTIYELSLKAPTSTPTPTPPITLPIAPVPPPNSPPTPTPISSPLPISTPSPATGSVGPTRGIHATRTVLKTKLRAANPGQTVTLIVTVTNRSRAGGTPGGSVTFLDGTVNLGTLTLRHGKAALKTSSLLAGPITIEAEYTPSQGFAPSTAVIVEHVQGHRPRSWAAPSVEPAIRAVPPPPVVLRVSGAKATPDAAVTIFGGPTIRGLLRADQGKQRGSEKASGVRKGVGYEWHEDNPNPWP